MQFESSLKPKLIYVFRINDDAHKGCLKVGEATCHEDDVLGFAPCCKALNQAAKARIDQYTQTAGISYELLYTELTLFVRDKHFCSFNDKEVHNVLLRSGIKRKSFDINGQANEWFITDLETVKRAITAVKEGKTSLTAAEISTDRSPIIFRPEQREAIDKTKEQFRQGRIIICCGQGDWEQPDTTWYLKRIFEAKHIPIWVDLWGHDVNHDWNWWYQQVVYYMPYILG